MSNVIPSVTLLTFLSSGIIFMLVRSIMTRRVQCCHLSLVSSLQVLHPLFLLSGDNDSKLALVQQTASLLAMGGLWKSDKHSTQNPDTHACEPGHNPASGSHSGPLSSHTLEPDHLDVVGRTLVVPPPADLDRKGVETGKVLDPVLLGFLRWLVPTAWNRGVKLSQTDRWGARESKIRQRSSVSAALTESSQLQGS